MIKTDPLRYLGHGAEIKKDLENNISFFKSGRENYTKYLPPRIAAAYYFFFDRDLYNNFDEKIINENIHFEYLLIQNIIYFLAVVFLLKTASVILSKEVCFWLTIFLCFEPTLLQYHGTFWSESIFFSIQIIIIALLFKKNNSIISHCLIGIFIGILSLQKQMAIFYIVPIILFYLFFQKKKKINSILFLVLGFFIIQFFLGYQNLQRSGKFYIMTSDTKLDLHRDLVFKVVPKNLKITNDEFDIIEGKAVLKWMLENSLKFNSDSQAIKHNKGFMSYRATIINESDKIYFDNYIRSRTFDYFYEYPFSFMKFIAKSSIHTALLNPFHIYSEHNFVSSEFYYTTKTHDQLLTIRFSYTLFIYLICLYGIYVIIKKREFYLISFVALSFIYFYSLVSWHGNTRYYVPCLIYLSFLFEYGMPEFLKGIKLKKNFV